ncbi:hypothetical protein L873DRAFT_1806426, partial [Choiromyces venosus 120613-1]
MTGRHGGSSVTLLRRALDRQLIGFGEGFFYVGSGCETVCRLLMMFCGRGPGGGSLSGGSWLGGVSHAV